MLTNINLPIAITFDSEQSAEAFMAAFVQVVPKAKVTVVSSDAAGHKVIVFTRKDKAYNELIDANFGPNGVLSA